MQQVNMLSSKHQLFHLAWPIFVDMLLHIITISLNIFMIGKISNGAVASLTVGSQVFEFCIIVFNFIGIGSCVAIAQLLGAKRYDSISSYIHVSIGFNLIVGILTTLGILYFSDGILHLMQIKTEIYESSHIYLKLLTICIIPEAITLCCASILRAYGLTKQTMYTTLVANVITVIMNLILLFGFFGLPKMGITGAAISMVTGRIVALVIIFILLQKYIKIRINLSKLFHWHVSILRRILRVGLPGAGENLSWHVQFMICTAYIAYMGVNPLATHTYYFQICLFTMMAAVAIGSATEIIVARHIGNKSLKEAYTQVFSSVKVGFWCSLIITIVLAIGPGEFIMRYISHDEEIVSLAHNLFFLSILMEPGRILNIIIINALRAAGDAKFPMVMAIASMWMVSVPLSWFLGIYLDLGILGVWIAFCLDEWTRGISMLIRWRTKSWVKKAMTVISSNKELLKE